MKEYQKYTLVDNQIIDGGTQWLSDADIANWLKDTALVEVGSELTNWEQMTIVDGELVKASADVIAQRQAAATEAYNEQQRRAREAEYRATTDPRVMELIADATPEIAALKAQIREKYPYK